MIHGPAFYKLLGIPESVEEPTAYHLLGLDPRVVTDALIDGALTERKLKLRQEIPGPQFIPLVEGIEQELEEAAATLRDRRLRQAYNERLLEEARLKKKRQETEERSRLVLACREVVRSMVDEDGCLPSSRRGELAGRLERLGLPADQVRYVLGNIPLPPEEATASSDEDRHFAREQAMQFFLAAIDLEISRGLLSEIGERKLMTLAAKFDIAPHVARRSISSRLMAVGADRGTRDETTLAAQFKLHVLAMFPMGDASDMDRRRLLALAAAEGLSTGEAQKVLDDYLGRTTPASPGAAGKAGRHGPQDPAAILESLAGQAAQEGASLARYAIVVIAAVVVATALMGAYAVIRTAWPGLLGHGPLPGGPGVSGPEAPAVPAEPNARSSAGSLLLGDALAALPAPQKIRNMFRQAGRDARTEALAEAAKVMLAAPTPREQEMLEGVFRCLVGCPSADGEVQNDAVGAQINALAEAARAAGGKDLARPGAQRLAALLASTLFLRDDPGFTVTDPAEMRAFLTRCRQAWDASRKDYLIDPANDPKRLAAAATAEGNLAVYGQRADGPHFKAVCEEVAAQAADPARPGSQAALEALEASGRGEAGSDILREARLALCTVLEQTSDAPTAERVRATLASLVEPARGAALRAEPVITPRQRKDLARLMRQAVNAIPARAPAVGAAGAATQAATAPAATQPKPAPRLAVPPLTRKVRAVCAKGGTTSEELAGLAVAMLACAERAGQWAGDSPALAGELRAVLDQPDPAKRVARLTRTVKWADRPKAEALAAARPSPTALGPQEIAMLEHDLRLTIAATGARAGAQFRAVEQLTLLDNTQAADILLKRLEELLPCGPADYPMVNDILHALRHMRDAKIPLALAEMIVPPKNDYVAHRIVMTLLEGSGRADWTLEQQWPFHLPLIHNTAQRASVAAKWKAVPATGPWGPGILDAALAGPTGPPAAWQSPKDNEKLLAVIAHYARQAAGSLTAHRPAAPPGRADAPKAPAPADIPAPIRQQDLQAAVDSLVGPLEALARQAAVGNRKLAVQVDLIDQADKAHMLACETPLQKAAVRLGTAGGMLEMLFQAGDGGEARKESLGVLRQEHQRACAVASDVLAEMRERCCYCLLLLELLRPQGG